MPRKPIMVFSLSEYVCEEMQARGWTIEETARRMCTRRGPAREVLILALTLCVAPSREALVIDDETFAGLATAFDVSEVFFRNLHRVWMDNPAARQPFEVPDELFGPWLQAAIPARPASTKPGEK